MEWAIAFLAVVIALIFRPKWTLWAMGAVTLALGVVALFIYISDERDSAKRAAEKRSVKMSAKYDSGCPKESPLEITIVNTNDKTLLNVKWALGVYEPGRSTNLLMYESINRPESDYILKSGERVVLCGQVPELEGHNYELDKLEYKVLEIDSVTFQQ